MIVGILGGGQLAQMMALAGIPLGLDFIVYDPSPTVCASKCAEHICASYTDETALADFVGRCDVITYDAESIPLSAAKLANTVPTHHSLAPTQDRLEEKLLCHANKLSTAPFCSVEDGDDIRLALEQLGTPFLLKTRRGGYDGKGQQKVFAQEQVSELEGMIGEGIISFDREVSIIGVRSSQGQILFYDLVENEHRDGILHLSHNRPEDPMQNLAEEAATKLMLALDHVGVFTVEFFDVGGKLLINEIAPRVHNSGHWTIEGAKTSQFENHLRAICGWPLGCCESTSVCRMLNLIGHTPETEAAFSDGAHPHFYGKEPRDKRKLGHITQLLSQTNSLV